MPRAVRFDHYVDVDVPNVRETHAPHYATRAEITQTMELVRQGKVTPIIGSRLPLEKLEEALRLARDGEVFGRIMRDIADPATATGR